MHHYALHYSVTSSEFISMFALQAGNCCYAFVSCQDMQQTYQGLICFLWSFYITELLPIITLCAGLRLNKACTFTVLRPFFKVSARFPQKSLVSGFTSKLRDLNSWPPNWKSNALAPELYTTVTSNLYVCMGSM